MNPTLLPRQSNLERFEDQSVSFLTRKDADVILVQPIAKRSELLDVRVELTRERSRTIIHSLP